MRRLWIVTNFPCDMNLSKPTFFLLTTLILLLAACGAPALPTPIPTAQVPTAAPTHTPPPPTRELSPVTRATSTALPPSPTNPPTRPTATPAPVTPIISISQPAAGDLSLVLGSELVLSGLAQRNEPQTIWVTLITPDRIVLVDTPATFSRSGGNTDAWQASFTVPEFIVGPAQLQATIRDSQNQIVVAEVRAVTLTLDASRTPRFLALQRPVYNQNVVAGYYLFMDGQTGLPAGGLITMKILTDDCQTEAARQSFAIGGGYGSYWYGYIGVPRNLSGPACAIAYFGTPGADNWRQALVPINILAETDEAAAGIFIVNPTAGSVARAGQSFAISGLAYNAVDDTVLVTITLDGGQILSQATAVVDDFGYWELNLTLPPDIAGSAAISAVTGLPGDDYYVETQLLLTIEEAP